MAESLPDGGIVLVRHGATEWSEAGRHTGRTDLPLLPEGRRQAQELSQILHPDDFGRVLCSPLRRARETCELAGFGDRAEITEELHEWDYGEYEGLTTPEIRERRPDWWLWSDGCPEGESPEEVGARADQVIALAAYREVQSGAMQAEAQKPAILVAHGHILRVLSARWIGLEADGGSRLVLKPAALGLLGHERETRVIDGWNLRQLA
ncbi:MAG TPA: histidine phosphatase family protein [Solirubrobacteraceae bacterium]|jgi:probable phosphoglycerate mutase|nr:histidine phosphatase family protein [Solirubrobacteraceae bacterium]